jgi:thiamine pyrophosphokinase
VDNTNPKWALIVAGGNPVKTAVLSHLGTPSWVVAADSGLDEAYRLGIAPDIVVGDMDSVTAEALAKAEADGVMIERHPIAKDATDLELAIDAAVAKGYGQATIIGGTGGRMAHTLANAMVLLKERTISLDWRTSLATIAPIRTGETRSFGAVNGALLSVLAIGGPAHCASKGLRWPLDPSPLVAGSTRGISNEITEETATVSVSSGQVLTIHERT